MKIPVNKRFEIAKALENQILSGEFKPGDRLSEAGLSREYGVSQGTIREAFQDLEALGLIVKYPRQGSYVIQLTADDLYDNYQLRRELEPLAFSLAATRMTESTVTQLQECMEAMRTAAKSHNFQACSAADLRFHRIIWSVQPNRLLEKTLQAICLPYFAYDLIRRYASGYVDYQRVIRQHELIVKALRTRDEKLVANMIQRMEDRWLRQDLLDYESLPLQTKNDGQSASNRE